MAEIVEPKFLLLGRLQTTLDIQAEELKRFGRDAIPTNSREVIKKHLDSTHVDFIVMGAGLADPAREELVAFIRSIDADIPIHLLERTEDANPAKLIAFANEKAILFKVYEAAAR